MRDLQDAALLARCSGGGLLDQRGSEELQAFRCARNRQPASALGWALLGVQQGGSSHTSGGTPAAILPTSSSACIIFLMRAAGKRGLSPFGGMSAKGEGGARAASAARRLWGRHFQRTRFWG